MEKRGTISAMGTISPATIIDDQLPVCERCGKVLNKCKMPDFFPQDHKYNWSCKTPECRKQDDEIQKELDRKKEIEDNENIEAEEKSNFLKEPSFKMNKWGVFKKYHNTSLDNFSGGEKYTAKIKTVLQPGRTPNMSCSLYLYGNCGSGKTHLSVAILRELYLLNTWLRMSFRSVSELLLQLRDSFHNDAQFSEYEIVENCTNPDILVLDDLGTEKTSEFSIATLYSIINSRLMDEKPTIVTSNLSRKQFEEKVDGRIASRFAEYMAIHLDMPDYRKQKGTPAIHPK